MAEDEAVRDFDAWLAAVNNDLNAAIDEHLTVAAGLRSAAAELSAGRSADAQPRDEASSDASGPSLAQMFGVGTPLEDVSFLTVAEVAGVMRVSKMTVYRMVHSGELTVVRVGRSFRVPAIAVREYLSGVHVVRK